MTARFTTWLSVLDCKAGALLRALAFRPYAGALALALLCCALYLPGIATLPVTDRDEARFAQASRQMIETGNYIDIRFQTEPRYKKPIGIYWLQAASVQAATKLGAALDDIWAYRIPSFLGALGAVLLTYWAGRAVIGRENALMAAALFATCLMLAFESRIAKSDAALICSIVLMQGALFRLYAAPSGTNTRGIAALFWLGLGAGILIKGPVAPGVALLTAAITAYQNKNRDWLKNLHWKWGVPLLLAITLPWFIAIGISSGGAFFKSSLGQDFAGKIQSGQEAHWGPPGLYLLLFWWTFWPAALFATAGGALALWRGRRSRRALFLLAWILPFWLMIEAIPTKLPHYALPLYPAIAMALIFALRGPLASTGSNRRHWGAILWAIIAAAQIVFLIGVCWVFEAKVNFILIPLLAIFAGLSAVAAMAAWQSRWNATLIAAALSAMVFYTAAFKVALPSLDPVWISTKTATAARALASCGAEPPAITGFSAPSTVFLNGTHTVLSHPAGAADTLASRKASIAFVNWRNRMDFEQRFAQQSGSAPRFLGCVDGVDINGGGPMRLQIYARPETVANGVCAPLPETRCLDKEDVRWRRILNAKF